MLAFIAELVEVVAQRTGVRLSLSYVQHLAAAHRGGQLELLSDIDPKASGDVDNNTDNCSDPRVEVDDHATEDGGASTDDCVVFDPPPVLPEQVSGRHMGLALYYPALAAVGVIEVARSLFALPRSERFGVRAVFQTLFFMSLLSRTAVESAKHLRRLEFGAMVGAGRAPGR